MERSEYIHRHERTHCFTDGIGIISPRLAKQLAEKTKSLDGESYPCAFQIRCGGYKGERFLSLLFVLNNFGRYGLCRYFQSYPRGQNRCLFS